MKTRLIALLLVLGLPNSARAGELFPGYIETGGYGTAAVTISQLGRGGTGTLLGAGGGFMFNDHFSIGAQVDLLVDDLEYTTLAGDDRFIEYTTANLRMAYTLWPHAIVHPMLSLETGLGWIRLRNPDKQLDENDPDADTVYQVQPMVHGVLNLTRSTRLSLAVGYRWVSGVNTEDFLDKDADGALGQIAVSFGAY